MTAREAARRRRLARLRATALPIFRDAVKPTRMAGNSAIEPSGCCSGRAAICRTNARLTALRPRAHRRKSRRFSRRASRSTPGASWLVRRASSAQALATLGAAGANYPPTTHRGHAGAKAVAPFAHEPARLVRSFHGSNPRYRRMNRHAGRRKADQAAHISGRPLPVKQPPRSFCHARHQAAIPAPLLSRRLYQCAPG